MTRVWESGGVYKGRVFNKVNMDGEKRKGVYIWCMLGSKLMCVPINPITFQDEQQEFLNNYIPKKT